MKKLLMFVFLVMAHPGYTLGANCSNEEMKFCGATKATIKDDYYCLYNNFDKLGEKCKDFLKEELKERPCFNDSLKHCKGEELRASRVLLCLKNKQLSLSNSCKTWLDKVINQANKKESLVIAACPDEWRICFNNDFRKQRACMNALKESRRMSERCSKVYTQALKSK